MGRFDVYTGCTFEYLYDGFLPLYFEDLPAASSTIREGELDDFVVRWELWVCSERVYIDSMLSLSHLDVV